MTIIEDNDIQQMIATERLVIKETEGHTYDPSKPYYFVPNFLENVGLVANLDGQPGFLVVYE